MKAKITFTPQAWQDDYAIDVDPEGETTFTVDVEHLENFTQDALKYELEPYLPLPQTPEWIKTWPGPFYFQVEAEDGTIILTKEGEGHYSYEGWSIQNPHLMYEPDPDKSWYATEEGSRDTLGPFDDLEEVRDYLHRFETIDEWRGSVCAALRDLGYGVMADEFHRASDEEAMAYRDTHEDPKAAAELLASESRFPPTGAGQGQERRRV